MDNIQYDWGVMKQTIIRNLYRTIQFSNSDPSVIGTEIRIGLEQCYKVSVV
jgi:hypothetical protein